jgi:hypothetical protein
MTIDEALRRALWRLLYGQRPPGAKMIGGLLSSRRSSTLRDSLQDVFEEYARRLAKLAAEGLDSKWMPRAERAIRNQLVAQRSFALRRALMPSELMEVAPKLDFQMSRLIAFEEEVKATSVQARSEAVIGARLSLYSGAGRAEWFRGEEDDAAPGDVVDYQSLDDNSTCTPCLLAEEQSPYPPGEGPFPGEVCLGRGRCRCKRVVRRDRLAALRLGIAA